MFRFLLSAVSIFVLLITTFLLPQAVSARLCDERMPLTLLALYRTSDAIYVGKYEKSDEGEVTEETADYRVIPIKKHFSISSALKGESRKMMTLEDTEYRYKNQEVPADEEESEHEDLEADEEELTPGDSVLLFVKKNEESGAIEPTEASDGIKKMTPDKLSAYEARIRELKGILSAEKPKYSQLVNWMVRSAEDPHTRWEGTFELLQSFQNMDWQDERAKLAKEKPADTAAVVEEEYVPETPKDFDTGDPNFARNFGESQKLTLTNLLLKRERPAKGENGEARSELAHGDRELIELVKRWGDSRVAANLLEQLRIGSTDANLNSELMGSISSMLNDDELGTISDEYSNIQWDSDEAVIEDGPVPPPASVPAEEAAVDKVPQDLEESAVALTGELGPAVPQSPETGSVEPAKKKKTYGDLRGELMAKFLARADKVIAREQSKNVAKLKH